MGRGGGGGGHHSSGGSHRSSGGRSFGSSSGGRGGRGYSSSSSRSYSSHHHYHHHYGGGYYGSTWSRAYSVYHIIGYMVGIIILFALVIMTLSSGARNSTVERSPIKPVESFQSDCIYDNINWIFDKAEVLSGMKTFYSMTGVQPYLYIDDNIDGEKRVNASTLDEFANEFYNSHAINEQCVVLFFFEWYDSDVTSYYCAGTGAKSVMDTEACEILMDYTEALYTSDLSDEEYFSEIFSRTSKRIMSVTPTVANVLPVLIVGMVIIALVIAVVIVIKMKHKRDKEKAEETERILHTPVDRL